MDLFRAMKKKGNGAVLPTIVTYNTLMRGMKRTRDYAGIVRLYSTMMAGTKGQARLQPDIYIFGMVIYAFCELGRWDEAIHVHNKMVSIGVVPNEVTYTALIDACGRAGEMRQACDLLREMEHSGVFPGVRAYSAAIAACKPSGDWRVAKMLLEELNFKRSNSSQISQRQGPTVLTYTSAISTCIKYAEFEWASQLMNEMRSRDLAPNRYTYNVMLRVCAEDAKRRGDLHVVLEVFHDMTVVRGVKPDSYTFGALLTACKRAGNGTQALLFVEQMLREGGVPPRCMHFDAALGACVTARGGSPSEAAKLLAMVDSSQLLTTRLATLAVKALGRCRDPSVAVATYELLQRNRRSVMFSLPLYGLLVEYLARSDCVDLAYSVLQEAEESGYRTEEATYVRVQSVSLYFSFIVCAFEWWFAAALGRLNSSLLANGLGIGGRLLPSWKI